MLRIIASVAVGIAALLAGPTLAADMPEYPPIDVPQVDYDLGGAFYLRGSAGVSWHYAKEVVHPESCSCGPFPIDENGYGYSIGAGFGYETGTGLRFDGTIDLIETRGAHIYKPSGPDAGDYSLMLRSTLALANVYYDFSLGGGGFGYTGSGAFAYVGAGAGVVWNHAETNAPEGLITPTGGNVSGAAALMAGVGYDMGAWVADVGYRGVYIAQVNNRPTTGNTYYEINDNFVHELRSTVRYRFN